MVDRLEENLGKYPYVTLAQVKDYLSISSNTADARISNVISYATGMVEHYIGQEVIANNKDEADNKFTECGLDHSKINFDITDQKDGVETYMVDANYTDSDTTKYMGRVMYDTDTFDQSIEEAKENGDVTIDTWVEEKEVMTEKEKDENAGVARDKDGNVISEVTNG